LAAHLFRSRRSSTRQLSKILKHDVKRNRIYLKCPQSNISYSVGEIVSSKRSRGTYVLSRSASAISIFVGLKEEERSSVLMFPLAGQVHLVALSYYSTKRWKARLNQVYCRPAHLPTYLLKYSVLLPYIPHCIRASTIRSSQQAIRIKIIYLCLVGDERREERMRVGSHTRASSSTCS
jgi:hypothetical protein